KQIKLIPAFRYAKESYNLDDRTVMFAKPSTVPQLKLPGSALEDPYLYCYWYLVQLPPEFSITLDYAEHTGDSIPAIGRNNRQNHKVRVDTVNACSITLLVIMYLSIWLLDAVPHARIKKKRNH
ncbi:hypothetical protein KI387_029583, partial [Taxus chinensis]